MWKTSCASWPVPRAFTERVRVLPVTGTCALPLSKGTRSEILIYIEVGCHARAMIGSSEGAADPATHYADHCRLYWREIGIRGHTREAVSITFGIY